MRMDPVRISRVADETDQLPGLDALARLQALRERDTDLAAAAVVVARPEVVVQVDVVVGRPALAVEVEHAAGPVRPAVEADASGLGGERISVARREDVDSLVAALGPRRAVVVAEVDRAQDREDDLILLGFRLRLLLRERPTGVDWERSSGPCGEAEEGGDEKYSGCRPEAHH